MADVECAIISANTDSNIFLFIHNFMPEFSHPESNNRLSGYGFSGQYYGTL